MFENESCKLCPKTFPRKDSLNRHMKAVHELVVGDEIVMVESKKKKPYCEMCDASFSLRSNLIRHVKLKHEGYDDKN